MNLSDIFTGVAHKRLVTVDLPRQGSNQHELNGVFSLRELFGTSQKTQGTLAWHYFADDQETLKEEGGFSFYDAREKSKERTGRTEWRMYYTGEFLKCAKAGDLLIFAITRSGQFYSLVFEKDSAWMRAAQALFGEPMLSQAFDVLETSALQHQSLEILQRQILEELGLEIVIPVETTDEEIMIERFGHSFPSTKIMSDLARSLTTSRSEAADDLLLSWLDREEQLFRALENVLIQKRLETGFNSADEFIEYSLSVQNRRKSRMGYSLQNHLAVIFDRERIRYDSQAITEGRNRPDFIFPGKKEYDAFQGEQEALLVMLGVKSTSKDRWRQVLDEADKIKRKHLCTLEAGISVNQTDAMTARELTLVVPRRLHETYTEQQRAIILDLSAFIAFVRERQERTP